MIRTDACRGPVPPLAVTLVAACGLAIPMPALAQGPLTEPFPAVLLSSELDGEIGFVIEGVVVGERFGFSVGALGDFNGDGVDDAIVGAPLAQPVGHPGGGKAYLVFGSAAGFPAVFEAVDLDGLNGLVLEGARGPIDNGERAGSAVAGAGDVNGDGLTDAIIGAPQWGLEGVGLSVGKAYVVFGGDDGFEPSKALADLDGADGFAMPSVERSDQAGRSVSSAGDTNGDGIDDIFVGVHGRGEGRYSGHYYRCCPGAAYVIYGRDAAGGAVFDAQEPLSAIFPRNEGYPIVGGDFQGDAGWAVASAGDINGDGFGDLVLSAPEVDTYYGECYVVFGKPTASAASINVRTLDGTNGFRMTAPQVHPFNYIGRSVDSARDFNGDGIDDLMIGTHAGALVVFGRDGGFPAEVDLGALDGTDGVWLRSSSSNDVAAIGDINDDGIDDVAIGDRRGSTGGSVYIVFGSREGYPATLEMAALDGSNGFRVDGTIANENFGQSVSAAGDINGDGKDDVLIGVFDSSSAGHVYVVYGRSRPCLADIDGDGDLTIFDFLEFGNLFDAGDVRADFDGDGSLTLFDFLAFQNAFDAGCE